MDYTLSTKSIVRLDCSQNIEYHVLKMKIFLFQAGANQCSMQSLLLMDVQLRVRRHIRAGLPYRHASRAFAGDFCPHSVGEQKRSRCHLGYRCKTPGRPFTHNQVSLVYTRLFKGYQLETSFEILFWIGNVIESVSSRKDSGLMDSQTTEKSFGRIARECSITFHVD